MKNYEQECEVSFFLLCSEVIYTGPRKVTITVKETKTETGFPGETELISSHVTTTRRGPGASSATRELDDLMASLSDFKVGGKFDFSWVDKKLRLLK